MSIVANFSNEGDREVIHIVGTIDEDSGIALNKINEKASNKVQFDFSGIDNVNSSGVRAWIAFFRPFRETREVEFVNCPPMVIAQMSMVPSFYEGAKIISVLAPYACESCQTSHLVRFGENEKHPFPKDSIPQLNCPSCGDSMEFEDDEDMFFDFARNDAE